MLNSIRLIMQAQANPKKAEAFRVFVKNSQHETFIGVPVPAIRKIAKQYNTLSLKEIRLLLSSTIHEEKILAIIVLSEQFRKSDITYQQQLFNFYMKNKKWLTEWDTIDGSAPIILGGYLLERDKTLLYELALSPRLWDRRMAIVATLHFIRANHFATTLKLAKILLNDSEDLIHKATGWMLREVGKKEQSQLKKFLDKHANSMPRTMLRYAIERLPIKERQFYLKKPK